MCSVLCTTALTAGGHTCVADSSTTGYTNIVESQLNTASTFAVTAECAANYEGTAQATACTSDNGEYTLSGCTACSGGLFADAGNGNSCAGW